MTKRAGLDDPASKGLGVAMLDFDGDGWMDLFVANDTQPNRLYRNKGDGTFVDVAVGAGVAFSEAGVARAGMGVDAADYDGSGRPSLIIGNFSNEMMALYHNEGQRSLHRRGAPVDDRPGVSPHADLRLLLLRLRPGRPSRHLRRQWSRRRRHRARPVPRHLRAAAAPLPQCRTGAIRGSDRRVWRGAAATDGGRGAAYGDFDNDGDLDVLVTVNNGPARLLRNDGGNRNNVLRVQTIGTTSNRDGIGARVEVTVRGGPARVADRQDRLELRVAK